MALIVENAFIFTQRIYSAPLVNKDLNLNLGAQIVSIVKKALIFTQTIYSDPSMNKGLNLYVRIQIVSIVKKVVIFNQRIYFPPAATSILNLNVRTQKTSVVSEAFIFIQRIYFSQVLIKIVWAQTVSIFEKALFSIWRFHIQSSSNKGLKAYEKVDSASFKKLNLNHD